VRREEARTFEYLERILRLPTREKTEFTNKQNKQNPGQGQAQELLLRSRSGGPHDEARGPLPLPLDLEGDCALHLEHRRHGSKGPSFPVLSLLFFSGDGARRAVARRAAPLGAGGVRGVAARAGPRRGREDARGRQGRGGSGRGQARGQGRGGGEGPEE
jgi:hypothetical protein